MVNSNRSTFCLYIFLHACGNPCVIKFACFWGGTRKVQSSQVRVSRIMLQEEWRTCLIAHHSVQGKLKRASPVEMHWRTYAASSRSAWALIDERIIIFISPYGADNAHGLIKYIYATDCAESCLRRIFLLSLLLYFSIIYCSCNMRRMHAAALGWRWSRPFVRAQCERKHQGANYCQCTHCWALKVWIFIAPIAPSAKIKPVLKRAVNEKINSCMIMIELNFNFSAVHP